jgi:hypothetical protein
MCGVIPPLPQYVFMAWCSVKYRDNFTFFKGAKSINYALALMAINSYCDVYEICHEVHT